MKEAMVSLPWLTIIDNYSKEYVRPLSYTFCLITNKVASELINQ